MESRDSEIEPLKRNSSNQEMSNNILGNLINPAKR